MNGSVFTLNTILFILICIQTTRRTICANSCCKCIIGGHGVEESDIICDGNNDEIRKYPKDNLKAMCFDDVLHKCENIKHLELRHMNVNELSKSHILDASKSSESLKLIDVIVGNVNFGSIFEKLDHLSVFYLKCQNSFLGTIKIQLVHKTKSTINNKMISISLIKCKITSIDTNIMNEWLNLKMISLANNNIKRLNRVWFPPVLENLWSLDLSYNSIIEIPKDFFTGMPALRKLRLDNNSMKTLHDWWLGPVWNHLHEFWIDKNNMTCNPDLSWIPNATHPTFFDEGMCCSPRKQIMRYFHELRNLDEDITPLEPQSPYKSVNN